MRVFKLAALGLMLGVSTPAFAQLGTVDVGLHIRYSSVDADLNTDNGVGFGGRLGVFLLKNLALELETDMFSGGTTGGGDTKLQPVYIRLAGHVPIFTTRFTAIVGAAYLIDRVETPDGTSYTDKGLSLNLGVQREIANSLSVRADLVGDVVKDPWMEDLIFRPYKTGNWHLNIGGSYRFAFMNRGGQ